MTEDETRNWHQHTAEEEIERLSTDPTHGLSRDEAERRLEEYGPNVLETEAGPGAITRFLHQFHQPLIYILIVAGVVTLLLAEYVDSGVIFGVVILNAIVGYIQESRALSSLAALSKTMASEATVIRDRERHKIPSEKLVPGDIVVVQSGDKVPADLRLIRVRELQIEEAAFTGESIPVPKDAEPLDEDVELADRKNMAFSSTLVTNGHATGVVVATGNETEVGRISELIESAEDIDTPLTRRITSFSRMLLMAILALAAVTFVVGLLHGEGPADVFLASVALAVAAIPEGLPAAITITLAIGVNRMAARRAIIRKLPAVETLGSTTVICSDKTGTLTENQMTVQRTWSGGHSYDVTGVGYAPDGEIDPAADPPSQSVAIERCLLAGLLCNDSSVVEEEGRWVSRGDPTEAALIVAANKHGLFTEEYEDRLPRIDAIPFESRNQYMATLHEQSEADSNIILVKGAAEAVASRCDKALSPDGELIGFDPDDVHEQVRRMAADGLRVLAFAQKEVSSSQDVIDHRDVEEGLVFLGLQGMIDPPRNEAIEAVRACKRAGITVKMITGDHAVTAAAIARELGIGHPEENEAGDPPNSISGRELESISDEELVDVASDVHVFARVPPDGKLRLVRALQSRGHIVAMTGDGVNDGPALRQADIGIAMGITGTEVAKDASDMVLTDDNFASIQAAVEEGRGVFDNLTKFLIYLLPTNLGQGLVILMAILFGTTLPMLPVQVLWVNMTTAVLLGLMLAFEPKEMGIMERPPRDPSAPILNRPMVMRMLLVALILLAGAFGLFHWAEGTGVSLDEARTVAVTVFILVQTAYLFNCRSMTHSMFSVGVFSNLWIVFGAATMIILQLAFIYAPPMNTLFHSEGIGLQAWAFILGLAFATYLIVEAEKFLRNVLGRPATHRAHALAPEQSPN